MTAPESITVIRARGRRLTKRVRADGTIAAYDSARTYEMFEMPVADLAALAKLLTHLLGRPDCAVVRGGIIDSTRTHGVRRRVHADPKTGECPTLEERARLWLALDVDGTERPAGVRADDLAGCAAAAISGLPAAFRDVACIVQASGSHGLKPGMRLQNLVLVEPRAHGARVEAVAEGRPGRPGRLPPGAADLHRGTGVRLPCR